MTYCDEFHISRMAGCASVVVDSLDEEKLGPLHMTKLVKEVLGMGGERDAGISLT